MVQRLNTSAVAGGKELGIIKHTTPSRRGCCTSNESPLTPTPLTQLDSYASENYPIKLICFSPSYALDTSFVKRSADILRFSHAIVKI